MKTDSKVVFLAHPYFGVNNPTNNLRIYKRAKNSDKWTYYQCKSKEEYRKKIKEYIIGFYDYSRDEEKSHMSVFDYVKEEKSSLFDYFMGGKKEEKLLKEKQMRREEMAMLKDGSFLLDEEVPMMQKKWCNYIENSNIQLTVLSFNQSYVDENISIKELQKKIATEVMPKFLTYCGYVKPQENLEWIVALHSDREDNYHFHISWIEKKKCYKEGNNNLNHRIKLLLSDNENNFLKRQAALTIERKKLYSPALIKLEKDFESLRSFFNAKDQNFTLKDIKNLELEEKIVKLGFLLSQIRDNDKKYIKYKSLPRNEIGKTIRKLTNEIKRELYKDARIKKTKDIISKSISDINEILLDIDKRNNISNIGFESASENIMLKNKISRSENYVLNAIVNHALNNYKNNDFIKYKFVIEDIIAEVAFNDYVTRFKNKKINNIKKYKLENAKNILSGKYSKNKIIRAFERLGYEQNIAAEKFYEMFEDNLSIK